MASCRAALSTLFAVAPAAGGTAAFAAASLAAAAAAAAGLGRGKGGRMREEWAAASSTPCKTGSGLARRPRRSRACLPLRPPPLPLALLLVCVPEDQLGGVCHEGDDRGGSQQRRPHRLRLRSWGAGSGAGEPAAGGRRALAAAGRQLGHRLAPALLQGDAALCLSTLTRAERLGPCSLAVGHRSALPLLRALPCTSLAHLQGCDGRPGSAQWVASAWQAWVLASLQVWGACLLALLTSRAPGCVIYRAEGRQVR